MPVAERFACLIDAVQATYKRTCATRHEASELLTQVSDALAGVIPDDYEVGASQRVPGCRHLPRALALGRNAKLADIAEAFGALESDLQWRLNPNYVAQSPSPGFLDNYGFTDIIGPRGLCGHPRVAVGFLLLGPGLYYPPHAHPAAEVYHVISGSAEWQRDDEAWRTHAPGSCILHPPQVQHAMRCGAEPLFALYAWYGDLHTPAAISSTA